MPTIRISYYRCDDHPRYMEFRPWHIWELEHVWVNGRNPAITTWGCIKFCQEWEFNYRSLNWWAELLNHHKYVSFQWGYHFEKSHKLAWKSDFQKFLGLGGLNGFSHRISGKLYDFCSYMISYFIFFKGISRSTKYILEYPYDIHESLCLEVCEFCFLVIWVNRGDKAFQSPVLWDSTRIDLPVWWLAGRGIWGWVGTPHCQ